MTLDNITVFFKKHFWVIITILVFVIYSPVINALLFWDDDDNIINNAYVKNFDLPAIFTKNQIAGAGFSSNQYRPILSTSFAIEHALVGNWPVLYHLINILIHLISGFLIYKLLKVFLKSEVLPYILTTLFLIHPVNTEAVSYIAGRTDLLGLLFLLLPIYVLFRANKEKSKTNLIIIISFIFGILSKETVIILPGLIMFVYLFFKKSLLQKKTGLLIRSFIITFGLAIFYMVLRLTIFNFQNTLNFYQTQNVFTESILVRLYTFLSVLPSYIQFLFMPLTLYAERSSTVYTSLFHPLPGMGLLIIILFLAGFIFSIKKNKPLISFGIAWFFIALFPASNIFVPVNALITEHWLYIPFFGFLLIIGSVADQIKRINSGAVRVIGVILIGLYFSFFAARTYARNREWSDPIVFYEQTLRHSSSSIRVINNLAMLYANKNNFEKAKYYYEKAISQGDIYPQPHHNLGNMYANLGEYEKAEKEYLRAIKIDRTFSFSYNSLYNLYIFQKKTKKAEEIKKKFEGLFISR